MLNVEGVGARDTGREKLKVEFYIYIYGGSAWVCSVRTYSLPVINHKRMPSSSPLGAFSRKVELETRNRSLRRPDL